MDILQEHPDPEVQQRLVQLSDALCNWERTTGQRSVLIVRETSGFVYRAQDGKPGIPHDIPDQLLLDSVQD